MLYKKMQGRLGNQMFQYAAMRSFSERFNDKDVLLDFSNLGNKDYVNDLKDFNITLKYNEEEFKWRKNFSVLQRILISFVMLKRRILHYRFRDDYPKESDEIDSFERRHLKFLMKRGIYCLRRGYAEFDCSSRKDKYFDGYFESPKFFDNIREILLAEFTPKQEAPKKNYSLYKAMRESESVCISIRRGDWVANKKFNDIHFVCTPEYFKNAIETMKKMVKKPRFFVFSDDIEWVKNNMNFPDDTMYEDGTDPVWEKMRLMYSCKHFIISNSTFSWWVQYLSRNNNKVVIAPSKWKRRYNMPDIYQDNWTLVDID